MEGGSARAALTEILEVERDCCARLAQLIAAERRAIAGRDLDGLLEAVKEREVLQARWQRVSAAREAAPAAGGTSLATLAARDPDLAPLLIAVRAAATELVRAQRTNAAIVRGALAQVGDLLAALRRAQPGSRYDDRAALTAPLPKPAGAGWSA